LQWLLFLKYLSPLLENSYSSINGDKYCRNNCHCNYWHHWHHRHNNYTDH
jgi:hypothetical protein